MASEKLFDVDDDNYEFQGSEELRKFAEEELRETDAIRSASLKQFREIIRKHPDIKKCRTDSAFLLRFLRTKKFSILDSVTLLERFLAIRSMTSWLTDINVDDPAVNAIIDAGVLVPLSKRDRYGRQVFLRSMGKFDVDKFTVPDFVRTVYIISECYMDDEENQIRGYTYLNDHTGVQMRHLSIWSINDIRHLVKIFQSMLPLRSKANYFTSMPSYAVTLLNNVKTLFSDKIVSRSQIYGSFEDLKEHIDLKILPKELGGEEPLADMIAQVKKVMQEKKHRIEAINEMDINLSNNKKYSEMFGNEMDGVAGSFRKLEVD